MPKPYATCKISFREVKECRRKVERLIAAEGLSIGTLQSLDELEKVVAGYVQTILVGQSPYTP